MARIVITVDGLAGSGKTSLSKLLAQRLGYIHFSSGSLYRAVALLAMREKIQAGDVQGLGQLLRQHRLELVADKSASSHLHVDGTEVTAQLYSPEVSDFTSQIAALAEVRQALIGPQRQAFLGHNIIADGRDMGTVIFLDADLKFYIEVPQEIRIQRRLRQLYGEQFQEVGARQLQDQEQAIRREILDRDLRDAERSLSPTKPALGALIVDNSSKTLTEVVESMYDAVLKKRLNK